MAELKPCPFCGNTPERVCVRNPSGITQYAIACMNGKCLVAPSTAAYKCKGKDARAWNRRAGEADG